jgi:outer membrane protein OmpA-like peptidoglycan-associated protein
MYRPSWTSLLGVAFVTAGCAGAPPSSLVEARTAYQRAAQSPARELAPDQLHAAATYLKTAELTYDEEGNTPTMRDRAYVAMRKAQLAEAQAGIVQANMDYKRADEQRRSEEQSERAAVTNELEATRAQLESVQRANAAQSAELQAETERREQAEAAQRQALAALEQAGEVKREARGTVITLSGSVIFASGQSAILPSARNKITEVASALSSGDRDSRIVVEGHTDATGSSEANQQLSLQRATAVRDALVANGVNADRIRVEGFGESRPIADNSSQAGRANNRRVEIVLQPVS